MRKLEIFSVYDVKAAAYLQPFFCETVGIAERSFEAACRNPEHAFSLHPEDFTLFHLGAFDVGTAVFEPLRTPDPVCGANMFSSQPKFGVIAGGK